MRLHEKLGDARLYSFLPEIAQAEASAKLAEQVRGIFRREGFPDCVH